MDYTVVGQTANLAARMEQMAKPGSVLTTADTLQLAEGYVAMKPSGAHAGEGTCRSDANLRGNGCRRRAHAPSGLRWTGLDALRRPRHRVGAAPPRAAACRSGRGQVVAIVGEAGVGKSRLVHEFVHSHHTADWLVLESNRFPTATQRPICRSSNCSGIISRSTSKTARDLIREKVTGRIFDARFLVAGRDSAGAGSPRCAG